MPILELYVAVLFIVPDQYLMVIMNSSIWCGVFIQPVMMEIVSLYCPSLFFFFQLVSGLLLSVKTYAPHWFSGLELLFPIKKKKKKVPPNVFYFLQFLFHLKYKSH